MFPQSQQESFAPHPLPFRIPLAYAISLVKTVVILQTQPTVTSDWARILRATGCVSYSSPCSFKRLMDALHVTLY